MGKGLTDREFAGRCARGGTRTPIDDDPGREMRPCQVARMDELSVRFILRTFSYIALHRLLPQRHDGSPTHRFHYVPQTFKVDQREHAWSAGAGYRR